MWYFLLLYFWLPFGPSVITFLYFQVMNAYVIIVISYFIVVSTFQSVHRISLGLIYYPFLWSICVLLRNMFLFHQFCLLAPFLNYFIQINIFSNFVYFRVLNLGSMGCLGVFWHTRVLKGHGPLGTEQNCVDMCMSE